MQREVLFLISLITLTIFRLNSLEPVEERALKVELQSTDARVINEALEIREQAFLKVKEGSYQEALELILKGLEMFPENFSLQTLFAAVLGDYSCNFSDPKKEIMVQRSKEIFDSLMLEVECQPKKLAYVFKNEYYYRSKMFKEQYDNGVKRIGDYWGSNGWISDKGFWGYYNQGVGAANFAKTLLMEGDERQAAHYAQKAIIAWSQFFSYDNTYYNSYVHYAMALGILGAKDEMMKAVKHGADLIQQDLNHPEFKEVIEFIDKYGSAAEEKLHDKVLEQDEQDRQGRHDMQDKKRM